MIRTSESVEAINSALAAFHESLPKVIKDAENPHFHSKFASLAANIEAADKHAAGVGLSVVQLMGYVDSQHGMFDVLTTRINHASGQWMESDQILHLPKEDPQGQGSAMTYGRRYNYQGAYGLAAEDDDAQSASDSVQKSGSTAAGKSQPPRTPTPRSSGQHNDGKRDDGKVGLIIHLAKGMGMPSSDLESFVRGIVSRPHDSLGDLTPEEQQIVLGAIRAKEKEGVELVQTSFGASEEPF